MKKLKIILIFLVLLGFGVSGAAATTIGLIEYGFNIDGVIFSRDIFDVDFGATPSGVNATFDFSTGLGSFEVEIMGAGAHNVDLFVDHEIDEMINSYFNETGSATGAPAAGQSWEIDEPGFFDGDIVVNFENSALDNGIGTSIFGDTAFPEDVSMAMGWDFDLAAGETATVDFLLSLTAPTGGFFLTHTDPDSSASIYFSGELTVVTPVSEPATILLAGTGLLGLLGLKKRRFKK